MYLVQTGDQVSGGIVLQNFPLLDSTCATIATITYEVSISGTLSGTMMSGTTFFGDATGTFTATISDTTFDIAVTIANKPGMLAFNRTSRTPPSTALSGAASGTYSETDTISGCSAPTTTSYSGTLSGTVVRTGPSFLGVFPTTTGGKFSSPDSNGVCKAQDFPVLFYLFGSISGNTVTGTLFGSFDFMTFTGTVSGTTLQGLGQGQTSSVNLTLSLAASSGPAIVSFSANPTTIDPGQKSTLSWQTTNATGVTLDQGIGNKPANGSVDVTPTQTTTYTLTAIGAGSQAQQSVTVTVRSAKGPIVAVSARPSGMLQEAGSTGGIDNFSITNTGDASTQITLTQTGSFFTINPKSFTLGAGQTQVVFITASAQPAGPYEGTVTVSGTGVPTGTSVTVRLLSVTAPTGTVAAVPSKARVESVAPANVSPSGSVDFANPGNDTLSGIAVADVPWIIPQSGVITIPPGQTRTVTYQIDRTKRPDASGLVGSETGKLSLVFLTGSAGSFAKPAVSGTGSSKTVSVTLVDSVKPAVSSATPSPLAAGEVAMFASGLRVSGGLVGDLALTSRASTNVNDLKMYAAASATPFSKLLSVPALTGDIGSKFASVAGTTFDINGPAMAVQLRSAQASSLVLNPVQVSTPNGKTSYATALPVLRSDAGAQTGSRLFLAGMEKSATSQTALYLQEMTGHPATVQTEFLDTNGTVISSRSDSLAAFGFQELADSAPAGAASARVTNTSPDARLAAYALVSDSSTGDAWTITDPHAEFASSSGDLIVPVFPMAAATQRFVDLLNTGTASTSVTVREVSAGGRRHAARRSSIDTDGVPAPLADTSVSVGPQQMNRYAIGTVRNGYIRLTATAPIVANGRMVATGTNGSFGTGLPAIPVSASIAIGQNRRFTGIDDASAQSVIAATPGTYQTNLALVETAGQAVKVRVTLRYVFSGGTRTSGSASSQREVSIAASQVVFVTDIARSIIGISRDTFGDLRNMELDIDVIEGGGRVIPALGMVDNSTQDLMVRVE